MPQYGKHTPELCRIPFALHRRCGHSARGPRNGHERWDDMDSDYPDDDDGDALRQVKASGADMSKPMTIEYSIAAPDLANAQQLCRLIAPCGYDPQIYVDDDDQSVSIYCGRRMLATYAGVVSCQAELNRLCEPYGAQCDGWGTLGNAPFVMTALAGAQLRH